MTLQVNNTVATLGHFWEGHGTYLKDVCLVRVVLLTQGVTSFNDCNFFKHVSDMLGQIQVHRNKSERQLFASLGTA
jgi:hypothetical protein